MLSDARFNCLYVQTVVMIITIVCTYRHLNPPMPPPAVGPPAATPAAEPAASTRALRDRQAADSPTPDDQSLERAFLFPGRHRADIGRHVSTDRFVEDIENSIGEIGSLAKDGGNMCRKLVSWIERRCAVTHS